MVVYRNKPKSLRANLTYLSFRADTLRDWERLCDGEGKATYLRSSNLFGTYLFFSLVFVVVQCRCFLLCVTLSSKNTNNTRGNWTREISYKKLRPRLQWWFWSFLIAFKTEWIVHGILGTFEGTSKEWISKHKKKTNRLV